MSEMLRQKAEDSQELVKEATAVTLPEPRAEVTPLEQADAPMSEAIRTRMAEIDIDDTNTIVSFGSRAQAELQEISQAMLQDVRNKDVGPAGDSLRDIVTTIRGFSVNELDVRRKRSWWEKLLGRAAPFAKFTAQFEEVQGQIDRITEIIFLANQRLIALSGATHLVCRAPFSRCRLLEGHEVNCEGNVRIIPHCPWSALAVHPAIHFCL